MENNATIRIRRKDFITSVIYGRKTDQRWKKFYFLLKVCRQYVCTLYQKNQRGKFFLSEDENNIWKESWDWDDKG